MIIVKMRKFFWSFFKWLEWFCALPEKKGALDAVKEYQNQEITSVEKEL